MLRSYTLRSVVACLYLLILVFCTSGGACGPLPASWRMEDPRLEKPVSLSTSRIFLGDLLRQLAAQSGVSLTMDERNPSSGMPLAVILNNVRLSDVLNALWSQVSFRKAEWEWERESEKGAYTYRFVQPRTIRDFASMIKQETQNAFEAELAIFFEALRMSEGERKEFVKKHSYLAGCLQDAHVMNTIAILAESVPREKLHTLLNGQENVRIALDTLSPRGKAFVLADYKQADSHVFVNGSEVSGDKPEWVEFKLEASVTFLSPSLMMHIEHIGGNACVGGMPLQKNLREQMLERWVLVGDARTNEAEKRKVPIPKPLPTMETRALIGRKLQLLGETVPVSLIARLPPLTQQTGLGQSSDNQVGLPYGRSLKDFLEECNWQPPALMHKWWDGILLLCAYNWYYSDEANPPLETVRLIDRALPAKEDLSAKEAIRLSDLLTKRQWLQLFHLCVEAHTMATWGNILALGKRYPDALTPRGAPIPPEFMTEWKSVFGDWMPQRKPGVTGEPVRFSMTEGRNPALPGAEGKKVVELTLQNEEGEVVMRATFPCMNRLAVRPPIPDPASNPRIRIGRPLRE